MVFAAKMYLGLLWTAAACRSPSELASLVHPCVFQILRVHEASVAELALVLRLRFPDVS